MAIESYENLVADLKRLRLAAMAEMLDSFGIEAVIVMLRNDVWANGLFEVFEDEF